MHVRDRRPGLRAFEVTRAPPDRRRRAHGRRPYRRLDRERGAGGERSDHRRPQPRPGGARCGGQGREAQSRRGGDGKRADRAPRCQAADLAHGGAGGRRRIWRRTRWSSRSSPASASKPWPAMFGERPLARVMPNIAAAIGKGVAGLYARDERARAVAHALFEPVGDGGRCSGRGSDACGDRGRRLRRRPISTPSSRRWQAAGAAAGLARMPRPSSGARRGRRGRGPDGGERQDDPRSFAAR